MSTPIILGMKNVTPPDRHRPQRSAAAVIFCVLIPSSAAPADSQRPSLAQRLRSRRAHANRIDPYFGRYQCKSLSPCSDSIKALDRSSSRETRIRSSSVAKLRGPTQRRSMRNVLRNCRPELRRDGRFVERWPSQGQAVLQGPAPNKWSFASR